MPNKHERETDIQTDIWAALNGRPDVRMFRNSVGLGYVGKPKFLKGGGVLIKPFRKVHFGLRPGSADLVGWKSVAVTADMVGKRIAVFACIEVKRLGETLDKDQQNWQWQVAVAGGISGCAHSVEEAKSVL
jgi:hypothetical protein